MYLMSKHTLTKSNLVLSPSFAAGQPRDEEVTSHQLFHFNWQHTIHCSLINNTARYVMEHNAQNITSTTTSLLLVLLKYSRFLLLVILCLFTYFFLIISTVTHMITNSITKKLYRRKDFKIKHWWPYDHHLKLELIWN